MNNISITPKGGTVASEVSGSQVNLSAPSVVKLHLNQSDIKSFTRNGNDLVVTTKAGEVVVIHNFYTAAGDSDLVLQDDKGALWWVEDPGTDGFQYVNIDSTEGLLAENTTNDGTIAAFGIGGAALAGLGAMFAGSSGGGGGNAAVGDGNTGGGDNGGGNNGGGNNGGGNNGGGNNGGGNNGGGNNGGGDTTAPTAATNLTLTDNVGAIQGAIVNGVTTDDNTPTLTGTAEAGATVSIYDGSTLLGTVVVGADGNWSFTSPALAEGQHSFTTTVTDAAGNTSGSSDPITFIVDTVAPVAAAGLVVSDDVGGTQGPLTAGSTTDDNTPTISGTAEPGTYVSVYDGTTLLGTATVGADGTWSFTTPALSNGAHSLTVTVTDTAGNVSAATDPFNFSVTADLPPATSTLEINDDNGSTLVPLTNGAYTDDNTPVLSGLATAGAVITLYDGETVLGSVVAGTDGQWVFTPGALADGSHAIHATITDSTGNSVESAIITINIDTVAPEAVGDLQLSGDAGGTVVPFAAGGATNDTTPTLSGTAEPGSTITVLDGTTVLGTAVVDTNGNWRFTTPALTEGSHSLTTTVTDLAGNTGPASAPVAFTVDTTAPATLAGFTVADNVGDVQDNLTTGDTTDDNTPTLSGQAEAGAIISIYDGDVLLGNATANLAGGWSFTTPALSNGPHSLTVTATDAAGNISERSEPFDVEIQAGLPPATSTLQVTDDNGNTLAQLSNGAFTNDNSPILSGLSQAGYVITLFDGDTQLGTVIVGSDGQWTFATNDLSEGAHTFHATITDINGNVTNTANIVINVDTVAPDAVGGLQINNDAGSVPVPVALGGITNDSTPRLSGTAEPGSTVTISDGTTVLGTATVGANGTWSFSTPALGEGEHSLTATVKDQAGNISPASDSLTFTVDTIAPAAASGLVVADNVGGSTGPLTSGGTTDDNTLDLTGQAEEGAVVTVYDGATLLGTVTAGAGGAWSFTTAALSNGSHSLTVTVTDIAGNVSPATTPFVVNIEAGLPPATLTLEVTDDSGSTLVLLADGDSTQDTTPVLSGLASAGAVVTLTDNGTELGTVIAGADGQWTFTPTALPDGPHAFQSSYVDATGNTIDSDVINVTIDTVAPQPATGVELSNDAGDPISSGGSTNDTTPQLNGSAEPGSTVTVTDGTTVLGTTIVGDDGTWTYTTPPLTEGTHNISTTVTDPAGNTSSASDPITVIVDTQAPSAAGNVQLSTDQSGTSVPITSGATNDTTPVLSGTAEPGSTVTVSDGGTVLGTATVGDDGNWSYTPTLTEGDHSLTTTVTDPAGNASSASNPIIVNVDTTAPEPAAEIQLSNNQSGTAVPITGDATNDTTPVLSGSAEPGSTVTVSDGNTVLGSVSVGTDGNWSYTTPALTEGNHSLTATVTDPAGNTSPATDPINFIIDVTPPAAATDVALANDDGDAIAVGGATNDTTPVLSGTATEGSIVIVSDGTNVLGSTIAGTGGAWSYTTPILGQGPHSITAVVTDPAGNSSTPSTPITFTVDTEVPDAAGDLVLSTDQSGSAVPVTGGTTNDTTPVLSGTAEPGSTITVSDNGTPLGTATVGTDGNWTFTPETPLEPGDHSLTTTVTDPAGNVSDPSTPIEFSVDTTPPDVVSDLVLSNNEGQSPVEIAAGAATNDTTPALSGTADAEGSIITVYDGTTVLGSVVAGAGGSWTFTTPTLSIGDHSLTVTVTDAAGNVSAPSDSITFTVDTQPPAAASGLLLTNGDDTAIATGGVTNDTTPVLSGNAEPGSTVNVLDGTATIGTATVGDDGTWTFTPDPALEAGNHSLSVTVTDPAGNTGPASSAISFNIDLTAPEAATGLQLSNNEGSTPLAITEGGVTNDQTPVLSGAAGSAEPGSTVSVYDNDGPAPLGTAIVGADGSWTFTSPELAAGDHSLTVTLTDPAGNVGAASEPFTFTVDVTPPAEAANVSLNNDDGLAIADGDATNDTTPTLSGSAEEGSIVTISDGTTVLGTVIVEAGGAWTYTTPTLSEGDHSLTATVTDPAGNVSAPSAPIGFTVDTTAPAAATTVVLSNDSSGTPVAITNGVTNDTTPVLSGSAELGSTVTVLDNGAEIGTATVDSNGSWTFTPDPALEPGAHSLTTTVTDAAGNTGPASSAISFTLDTTAPDAAINLQLINNEGGSPVAIANGGATNDTTPVLSGATGSAEPGSIVTIYDNDAVTPLGTATVGTDGSWSFTSPALEAGDHSLTVTLTDPAGNVSDPSEPFDFSVDLTAPDTATAITLANDGGTAIPAGGATNDSSPVLSGAAGSAEADSVITVTDGLNVLGTAIVGTDGSWSFTLPTLSEGAHSLTTTVTDPAGNVSDPSAAIGFTVDTVLPVAATALVLSSDQSGTPVAITNGTTNDTTPVLSGTAEAGTTVTVFADGLEQGTAIVSDDGTWTFMIETPLSTGDHSLTTSVTDLAGNTGPLSAPVTFTINTTTPDAAINLQLTNDEGTTPVTISNGGATNDTTPVLSGTALAGSVVTISDDGVVLGSVAVGANGNWSYTLPELDSGTDHSLTTVVTDPSGNDSAPSAPVTFSVDTDVPDAALGLALANDSSDPAFPIAAGGVTNDSTPLLTGTAEPNSIITVSDGLTVLGTTTADENGDWSFTPTLTDGDHSLSVTVTDEAGNTSGASAPVAVTIDTVAPVITNLALSNDLGSNPVAIPGGGLTNDNTPVVSGSAEEGTIITITEGNTVLGQITVDATGNWSVAVTTALSDGTHTLSVTARDPAGNTSAPSTISVEVDTAPLPAATGVLLSTDNGTVPVTNTEGTFTSDSTPLLSGSATAGSIINVYNGDDLLGTTTVGSNGAWSITLPNLPDETYTLSVRVVDAAGNLSPASDITFTVDTAAPPAATLQVFNNDGTTNVEVLSDGTTNDNTPLLSGAAEAGSLVIIYDGNQQAIGSTIALDDGTWSFQSPVLSDGTHTLTATVTDEIGNVSQPSATFTISVDATAPEPVSDLVVQNDVDPDAPVTIANGGATSDTTPAISGNAEPGSTVSIINTATGEVLGTAVADPDTGVWSYTTTTAWPEGTYNLGIVVTDEAGNASATTNFNITIDSTAPVVGTFTVSNNNGANPVTIPADSTTNDSTPVLRGTGGEAGSIINVYSDGLLVGSTIVADNGTWRVVTTELGQGEQTLSVTATDAAGNTSAATTYTLTVDTLAPEAPLGLTATDNAGGATGELSTGDVTDDNTPTFGGTAELGSIVSVYDGTTLLGSAVADATTGAWTFTPVALSNGLHNFTATATDAAGNVSPAAPQPAFELNIQADLPPATSTLQITDDSGSTLVDLADGDYTKDTSPVLTGVTTANAVVTILDGATELGQVIADGDGQWTFTPNPVLGQGEHAITVTIVDAEGNAGVGAGPITINIDSIVPDAVANLVVNNNNGSTPVVIGEGTSTNDNTPQLTGTTEAGGIVTIYDGTNVIGSTTAGTDGVWSFTTSTLTSGAHAVSVTVTDLAGNISPASATVNFTVDTIAPAAATNLVVTNNDAAPNVVIPNGGSTNDSTPVLSGIAEANSTVTIYDGTTVLGTATADGTGNWSYSPTLAEGTHTLSVRVTDAAGNVSGASSTATVIVDTTPPAVTIAASNNNGTTAIPIANNGSTNDSTPALSGTTDPGSLVIISENNVVVGSVTASSTGSWSYVSTALGEGQHTFSVTATDIAGNVSPAATVTVNVSLTGPAPVTNLVVTDDVAPVTGPLTSGATTNDNTPTLSGGAGTAGNIVTVYDGTTVLGTVIAGAGGAWTFTTAALSNGAHPLSVTVTDAAGNTSTATSFPITVDTVAPVASTLVITNDVTNVTVPNGGSTNDTTPTLRGTVSTAEAGGRVTISDGTTVLGTAIVQSDGTWSFTTTALSVGTHPLSVTVTDAAGNVSGTTSASVIIDTTAPGAVTVAASNNNGSTPIAIANGGSTNDNTPALSGTAEAGSVVIVREGTTVLGSTTASSTGAWGITSSILTDGTHNLSVTATDAAGNVSRATPITLIIDTGVPVASNLIVTNDVTNVAVPNGGSTNDSTPTLSGTAEANAVVTILDGTTVLGSVTAGAGGAWTFTPTTALSNGTHPLSVTVRDAAGNVSPASTTVTVIVDTVAPTATTLVITNDNTGVVVPAGGSTNDTTPTLSGVAEAGSRVSILDNGTLLGTAIAGSNGVWTFTTGVLVAGTHPLTATVTDAAGNVSGSTAATVIIDTTAPGAVTVAASNNNGSTPIAIANGGSTNDNTPALSGTAEAGSVVIVREGATVLGS
ncbi:Ig-like domain-containing protein, partial [Type-E symbiont of Plautia stali]|uniref:Ig-like domain-containing protein n=1 Tax=Type-E symbiont of Plautia stali TaxID=1560357 RepID=UPI00073F124E